MIRSLASDTASGQKGEFLSRIRLSTILLLNKKALKKRDHLVILYILIDNKNKILSHAMINNNVITYTFIDEDYARCKNLPLYKLKEPRRLKVFNGILTTLDNITHITKV